MRTRRSWKLIFEEFDVDEAGLKSGWRRVYIEAGRGGMILQRVCLFPRTGGACSYFENSGSRFETLSMHGGDSL